MTIILGIDPGLNNTGLGLIDFDGNKLAFIASQTIINKHSLSTSEKLKNLNEQLNLFISKHATNEVAIEETFVNVNPLTSLSLGQARGAIILTIVLNNLPIFEYSSTKIKKSVTSSGRASKEQISSMIKFFLPKAVFDSEHSADALAVAICHANNSNLRKYVR
ncbi:MAG: crossover junction endodeoxyribonuclease RuvC [Alphaproteobacteria bacterium]|jgi:crossover junction endodeoxyribonuclease RuvC